jgi:hypothetical protein
MPSWGAQKYVCVCAVQATCGWLKIPEQFVLAPIVFILPQQFVLSVHLDGHT